MFDSVQQRDDMDGSAGAVDIAPLIDIVFILLIFFLTTTTLLKNEGINVTRPASTTAASLNPTSLRIVIARSGTAYVNGVRMAPEQCRQRVGKFLETTPNGDVIIVPDEDVPARFLVDIMDAARLGGAVHLAIATRDAGNAGMSP